MNFSNIQKQGKIGLLHAAAKIPIPPQRAKLHQSRVHPGQHSWSQWQRYAPVASWGVALATGGRVALNLQLAAAGLSDICTGASGMCDASSRTQLRELERMECNKVNMS